MKQEGRNVGKQPIGKPTLIRFRAGVPERIDAVLNEGEVRADFIREAVDKELAQREWGSGGVPASHNEQPLREVRVLVSDEQFERMSEEGINLVRGKRPAPKRRPKAKRKGKG